MPSFLAAWRSLDDGRDRAEFYRMWQAGTAAGLTVPATFEAMGRPRPAPVDAFESALLLLGEETGSMEKVLRLLADFYARKHRLMLAVRKRMVYPFVTGIFATLIAPFPLLYFGHGVAYVVAVTGGLAFWILASGSLVAAVANWYGRSPAMVRARLARALATAVEAGLPLARSIRLAAGASADADVKQFVDAMDDHALTRAGVATTLARCPKMSPDFVAVLHVAETTGDYSALTRLANLYEDGFR